MSAQPVRATPEDAQVEPGTVLRLDGVLLEDGRLKVRCVYTPTGATEPKLYGYIIPRGDMDKDGVQLARRLETTLGRFVHNIKTTGIAIKGDR